MQNVLKQAVIVLSLFIVFIPQISASPQKIFELASAVSTGKFSLAQSLLDQVADQYINYPVKGTKGGTLLHLVVGLSINEADKLAMIVALLKRKADINRSNDRGQSPIFMMRGRKSSGVNVLRFLVENGTDINKKDLSGNTSLHIYIQRRKFDLVSTLIELGANVNSINVSGVSPVMQAVSRYFEVTEMLVDAGADLQTTDNGGNSVLHHAALKGNVDAIDYLIKRGVLIDDKNHRGLTGLSMLASASKWSAVRVLLERGASPYVPFRNEHSVAYYLLTHPELGMLELINKNKIDVNAQMGQRSSLLINAISNVDLVQLELLVELGVNVNQTFSPNHPAIAYIASKDPRKTPDTIPMLKRLLELGANINARKMGKGLTGLEVALRNGYGETVIVLLENGAVVDNQVIKSAIRYKQYAMGATLLTKNKKNDVDFTDRYLWHDIEKLVDNIEKGKSQKQTDDIGVFITKLFASKPLVNLKDIGGSSVYRIHQRLQKSASLVVLNAMSKVTFAGDLKVVSSNTVTVDKRVKSTIDVKIEHIDIPTHKYSKEAELHVVGVYTGTDINDDGSPWWSKCDKTKNIEECHRKYTGGHQETMIKIHVSVKSAPVILALMSYEPVKWVVTKDKGVKIEAVILSGYYGQKATGIEQLTPVHAYTYYHSECGRCQVGDSSFYAYKRSDRKFNKAMLELKRITQHTPVSFQGQYKGEGFSVID